MNNLPTIPDNNKMNILVVNARKSKQKRVINQKYACL